MTDVCFITDHVAYASSNKTKIFWIETELLLFYWGWMHLMFTCMLGCHLASTSYQYPNLSEGADRIDGLQQRDKECPFNGVTKSGRVWRKLPESDARSVRAIMTQQCNNESSKGVNISRKTSHDYNWHGSKYTRLCTLHKRYIILKQVHNHCHLFLSQMWGQHPLVKHLFRTEWAGFFKVLRN